MSAYSEQDFADELELLTCMYDPSELSLTKQATPSMTIQFSARPCVAANESHIFCSIDATVLVDVGYPKVPARVVFSRSRGFDDAQREALNRDLLIFAREQSVLGTLHLIELLTRIRERVTELNKPNPCPACLESVDLGGTMSNACIRLEPCWHAMHAECYRQLHACQVSARDAREKHLSTIIFHAREKAFENWICCPICRVPLNHEAANQAASLCMNDDVGLKHDDVVSISNNS